MPQYLIPWKESYVHISYIRAQISHYTRSLEVLPKKRIHARESMLSYAKQTKNMTNIYLNLRSCIYYYPYYTSWSVLFVMLKLATFFDFTIRSRKPHTVSSLSFTIYSYACFDCQFPSKVTVIFTPILPLAILNHFANLHNPMQKIQSFLRLVNLVVKKASRLFILEQYINIFFQSLSIRQNLVFPSSLPTLAARNIWP